MADTQQSAPTERQDQDQAPDSAPTGGPSLVVGWQDRPDAWQWSRLADLQDGTRSPRDDDQAEKLTAVTRGQAVLKDKQAQAARAAQAWSTAKAEEGQAQATLLTALDAALDGETEDQPEPAQDQPEAEAAPTA